MGLRLLQDKMKAYLAIKFYEDGRNKEVIESIDNILKSLGIDSNIVIRDIEKYGKVKINEDKLMELSFKLIDNSDILIIEFSEKGVGLGIEAGYAYSKNKPIIVIAKKGSDISATLKGIARQIIFYDNINEIKSKILK